MSDVAARGANLNRLGTFNESVVLHAIRRSAGISRVEIGELTGLAGQTVTNICRRLLENGLIVEGDKAKAGPGKPRTPLRINSAARVALGVHLDPAVTTLTMLDLAGQSMASETFPTPAASEPGEVVATIGEALNSLIENSGVDRSLIVGVGVATPGPVDVEQGVVVDPPHLPHWHRVPLRERLSLATGLPVLLDKDVRAAAIAETWLGTTSGEATSVVLYLGTGIGAGLVVDGQVVRGSSANAGEMGHIVVDPDGPDCECGQRGCVNATITSEALVRAAVVQGLLQPHVNGEGPPPSVHHLYDLADEGDDRAVTIVRRAAAGVARAALAITNLLDAEKVILGGPYWSRLAPYVLAAAPPLLEAGAAAHRIHSVDLVGTSIGDHLASVGAASLVLDQTFSPHPTRLVLSR